RRAATAIRVTATSTRPRSTTVRTLSRIIASQAAYSRGTATFTSRKRWLTPRISTVTVALGASADAVPKPVMLRTPSPSPRSASAQRRPELPGGHDGGSDLRDDDAGRMVREHRRLLRRPAGAEGERAGGDDGVARPRHVEDLAGDGRELLHDAAGFEERHALLAARDEDGAGFPALEEPLARLAQARAIADRDARCGRGLPEVRFHERRAPVVVEVLALRVDDPRERIPTVRVAERVQERRTDHALVVVGQHDDVEATAQREHLVAHSR